MDCFLPIALQGLQYCSNLSHVSLSHVEWVSVNTTIRAMSVVLYALPHLRRLSFIQVRLQDFI